jgi:galactokinase
VVCDTGVGHELASSGFNDRRADCEAAVGVLAAHMPGVRALRDVDPVSFARLRSRLPDTLAARAAHVISENARVIEARAALATRDLARFGALMYASHTSLRDDYEVSAPELDAIVNSARATPGVFGARMTGGGFGGSAIVLCTATAREQVSAAIERDFSTRFGRAPGIFAVRASEGAHELEV